MTRFCSHLALVRRFAIAATLAVAAGLFSATPGSHAAGPTPSGVQLQSAAAPLAHVIPIKSARKSFRTNRRTIRRGLTASSGGGGSAGGVGCHGTANCGQLLKDKGTQCKHWRCNQDVDGQPSCWCDL